jgi:hypothetical protein
MTAVYSHAERLREDRSKRVSPCLSGRDDGAMKAMIRFAEGQSRVRVVTERLDEALVGEIQLRRGRRILSFCGGKGLEEGNV